MMEQGLIVEPRHSAPSPEYDDERRRYYRITPVRTQGGGGGGAEARANWSAWRGSAGSRRGGS